MPDMDEARPRTMMPPPRGMEAVGVRKMVAMTAMMAVTVMSAREGGRGGRGQ